MCFLSCKTKRKKTIKNWQTYIVVKVPKSDLTYLQTLNILVIFTNNHFNKCPKNNYENLSSLVI